jgi:hypothetical protein
MEALQTIEQFNLTKAQVKNVIHRATDDILDGTHNVLEVMANIRAMQDVIDGVKTGIMSAVLEEAAKYGKTFRINGVEFTSTSRKTFDFGNTSAWSQRKEELKQLETMLKNLSQPMADPETGEMMYPPTFKVTETISITLPE